LRNQATHNGTYALVGGTWGATIPPGGTQGGKGGKGLKGPVRHRKVTGRPVLTGLSGQSPVEPGRGHYWDRRLSRENHTDLELTNTHLAT